MKQIIQNYRTGVLEIAEVPVPICSSDKILVKNWVEMKNRGLIFSGNLAYWTY